MRYVFSYCSKEMKMVREVVATEPKFLVYCRTILMIKRIGASAIVFVYKT